MRAVLRPGLRLHRVGPASPSGSVLVEHDRMYSLDPPSLRLLEDLDGLVEEATLLRRHPQPESAAAWRRLRESGIVVDVEAVSGLVRDLPAHDRPQALPEVAVLVADDPTAAERRWRSRRTSAVRVLGRGAVASTLMSRLHAAGVGRVHAATSTGDAGLTVLTHDHEPPLDLTEQLMRDGRPHLVAGLRGTEGLVGPLVVPGVTSCLRCRDLALGGEDPTWAALREQLGAPPPPAPTPQPTSGVVVAAVAALAAAEVLAHVEGREPVSLGATLSLSLLRPVPAVRTWPPQPACGCGWQAARPAREQWTA